MRVSELLTRDLSRGSVRYKATPTPRCWSTHYCFPVIKSLPGLFLTLPPSLCKSPRSPRSRFPLRSISTKDEGLHIPRTKSSTLLHTKPESRRRAGEPQRLQGWPVHQDTLVVHSKTSTQGSTPCSLTHLRVNLALTLTELVLSLSIWPICTWMAWRRFFNVCVGSLESSNSKMARGWQYIYRPPSS